MSETKPLTKEERCEGRVWHSSDYHSSPCTKRHQPSSRFCKTHDPAIIEQKRKDRDAKWKAKWDAKEKAAEQAEAARKLMEHKAACFDELLAACKEMREVAALCFRIILADSEAVQKLEHGMREIGIPNGVGIRCQAAIAKAEKRS